MSFRKQKITFVVVALALGFVSRFFLHDIVSLLFALPVLLAITLFLTWVIVKYVWVERKPETEIEPSQPAEESAP